MAYSYGLIRQTYDPRDRRLLVHPRTIAALPPSFELPLFASVPKLNQGGLGSCGPNTADESWMLEELAAGTAIQGMSRLFIYWNTRRLMGTVNQDSGVENRTMLKAMATYGACAESLWPYNDTLAAMRAQPPASCYAAALPNKIINYAAVSVDLDQIKGVVYQGHSITFGTDVFNGIQGQQASMTGVVPDPMPGETPIGGHDVAVIGFDDTKQRIKFRNHWLRPDGQIWGDEGCGYFSYKYAVANFVSDLWVINAIPGTITPPTPTPVPPTPQPPIPPHPHTDTTLLKNVASLFGWKSHEPASASDPISFYK